MSNDDVITYARIAVVERELLSPIETAHALGMSRSRLYEFMKAGKIASIKIGKSRRFHRSEVERFINSLTAQS